MNGYLSENAGLASRATQLLGRVSELTGKRRSEGGMVAIARAQGDFVYLEVRGAEQLNSMRQPAVTTNSATLALNLCR